MYVQVEKPKENRSRAVANSIVQKKSNGMQAFGFVDNRAEAVAQRKLHEIANNNAQGKRAAQLKSKIDNRQRIVTQRMKDVSTGTGKVPDQNGPYVTLSEIGTPASSAAFTDAQADAILAENAKTIGTGWLKFSDTTRYKSDSSGQVLISSSVTRHSEASVDHIVPRAKGGANSVQNAQILSTIENSSKGDTYPWGTYT